MVLRREWPGEPVRMVHLGLGGFFRAHQAWYTQHAPDGDRWGIAAFGGRSRRLADTLAAQDGLYTLIIRTPTGDEFERITTLSAVHGGADHAAWLDYWRRPELAVVTLTVTEAGYTRAPDGGLDVGREEVRADIAALRADPSALVRTPAARLLAGLTARRRAGLGPVAIVPCDNLPDNGAATARVVRDLAEETGLDAAEASYATTMVDRITPWTTDEDRAVVAAATGAEDAAPVVTEPFTEWVLSGDFPSGRPRWKAAGAHFTTDVTPYEERKLWLLNGAHSLLAYAAAPRGHRTVDEAVADPVCRTWLTEWWTEASRHLGFAEPELAAYRNALLERFANPRIGHALAKIAEDGSQKLPVRLGPVLRAERARGHLPTGAVRILDGWVRHLRGEGVPVRDPAAPRVPGEPREAARTILATVEPTLTTDDTLVDAIASATEPPGRP